MNHLVLIIAILFTFTFSESEASSSNQCHRLLENPESSLKVSLQEQQILVLNSLLPNHGRDGRTNSEVARIFGVSEGAISHLKTGRSRLSVKKAVDISRLLKISIWEVIGFISKFKVPQTYPFLRFHAKNVTSSDDNNQNTSLSESLITAQVKHLQIIMRFYGRNATHEIIASKMGVSAGTVSHLMTGRSPLSLEHAILLANALLIDPRMVLMFTERFDGSKL